MTLPRELRDRIYGYLVVSYLKTHPNKYSEATESEHEDHFHDPQPETCFFCRDGAHRKGVYGLGTNHDTLSCVSDEIGIETEEAAYFGRNAFGQFFYMRLSRGSGRMKTTKVESIKYGPLVRANPKEKQLIYRCLKHYEVWLEAETAEDAAITRKKC